MVCQIFCIRYLINTATNPTNLISILQMKKLSPKGSDITNDTKL